MENRDAALHQLRPKITSAKIFETMSSAEKFQNTCLRPIIKLQNDLIIDVFRNYIKKRKNVFYDLTPDEKLTYIEHAIKKDTKLQNSLKGMVIGHFTLKEYKTYRQDTSALNKRMVNIIKERLQSNVLLYDKSKIL